ncbi:MAG TPA: hypothetical protein VKU38_13545 [Ktedonobacteraceae bacterium]|nr:hypothetical protein [Ktedonobacteraceae bacterium]
MTEQDRQHSRQFIIQDDTPLIGIPFSDGNREVTRYFIGDAEADAAMAGQSIQKVLNLAGSWSDLDWDEMQEGLDHIRHQSLPTPPFEL